jgi:hypothetical protein
MGRPAQEADTMAKSKETATAKTLPSHGVFVVEGEGEKAFWTKIGCAWSHADNQGFNVTLSAVPLSGRIVLRTRKQEAGE